MHILRVFSRGEPPFIEVEWVKGRPVYGWPTLGYDPGSPEGDWEGKFLSTEAIGKGKCR